MAPTTKTADALLREAHERGYRFPTTFDGFTARIGWETPDGSGEGTAEVRLREESPVETSEIDDWANGQLRSIVAHRSPRPYEEGDGAIAKRITDDEHALGSRIELASPRLSDVALARLSRQLSRTAEVVVSPDGRVGHVFKAGNKAPWRGWPGPW